MNIQITCPECHFFKDLPEDRVPAGVKWARCPRCGNRIALPDRSPGSDPEGQPAPQTAEKPPGRAPCAWENRAQLGSWTAIYETMKGVMFSPTDLFGKMTYQGGLKDPLLFGVMLGSMGTMFGLFWNFLMMWGGLRTVGEGRIDPSAMAVIFIILLIFSPLLTTIIVLVTSAILHVLLLITGAGKHRFEATLRVVSYAQATQIWGVVPFVGGLVGNFWFLVVQIVGLREIHETSYWRVVGALVIPFALILILVLFIVIFLLIS